MALLINLKLIWLLSLCLLSEQRNINKRQLESIGVPENLEIPHNYVIEPVQTLTKNSDTSVTPPYDVVDFGDEDKLNEIESKIKSEDSSFGLHEAFIATTTETIKYISTENEQNTVTESEYALSKDIPNKTVLGKNCEKEKISENITEYNSNISSTSDKDTHSVNKELENNHTQTDTKNNAESSENISNSVNKIEQHQIPLNNEKQTESSEILTPNLDIIKTDKQEETLNSEKIIATNANHVKVKEELMETKLNKSQIIANAIDNLGELVSEENNNTRIKDKQTVTLNSENVITPQKPVKQTNNLEEISNEDPNKITLDFEKTNTLNVVNLNNSENIKVTNFSESFDFDNTTINTIYEKPNENLSEKDNSNKSDLKESYNKVKVEDRDNTNNNTELLTTNQQQIIQIISTTEKTYTKITHTQTAFNTAVNDTKNTSQTIDASSVGAKNNQTNSDSVQQKFTNQTAAKLETESTTQSIFLKQPENSTPAVPTKAIKIQQHATQTATAATPPHTTNAQNVKGESTTESTSQTLISHITQRPNRPSIIQSLKPITTTTTTTRKPSSTRRPLATRKPQTTNKPLTNPSWFSNFPGLFSGSLLPTLFINPFNTTIYTQNQTQSTFGFGVFALPSSWRPNLSSFFVPNRVTENRPALNESTVDLRHFILWNALLNRAKSATDQFNNTKAENITFGHWRPWNNLNGAEFIKLPKIDNNRTAQPAIIPANTQVLHLYFPIRYPFQGQIITETLAATADTKAKGLETENEEVKIQANNLPSSTTTSNSEEHNNSGLEESDEKKASLKFQLELPQPIAQFVRGIMETFMPQQN